MKRVSVAIPCRNEVKNIKACVEAALKSNYPDIEVIVVDGMSTDGTRIVLDQLCAQYKNFKYVDNVAQLTPYAFNLGIQNASGDYVQIVGSRNILDPEYIPTMVAVLENDSSIACVGGDYQHVYDTDMARYIASAMESKFGVGPGNYRTMNQDCFVDTVGVPMYRKSIFAEIGMFDERLTRNQDDDFNYRVTQKGHKIFYASRGKVLYYVRGTYKKLFRQYMQYGYFKVFVNKKHHAVTTLRQLVPATFLLFLLIGLGMSVLWNVFMLPYLSIIGLYLILGLVVSASVAKKWWEIFPIVGACMVMHIAYGQGYLKGIWDFLILNRMPARSMQEQTT